MTGAIAASCAHEPFCGGKFYAEIAVLAIMMTKEKIAEALEEIATLLELKEENPFKIRAYQNAARSIEAFGASFSDLQNQETLEKIPGIGKAIAAKISELATTGELKFLNELRAEFPSAILELFSIPGLGAKKIKALHEKLKIRNSMRPARGHQRRIPVRAQLFYRQQGAQHRDAKSRAQSRLDPERIPARARAESRG